MIRDEASAPPSAIRQYRLSWRWRQSGTTGNGPWMHNPELLQEWLETFERRGGGAIEHWIDSEEVRELRRHGPRPS